jgi:hypothetical protein
MKNIKLKSRGAKCHWCDEVATKRGYGINGKKACPAHGNALRLDEEKNSDDGYVSAGESQALHVFGL